MTSALGNFIFWAVASGAIALELYISIKSYIGKRDRKLAAIASAPADTRPPLERAADDLLARWPMYGPELEEYVRHIHVPAVNAARRNPAPSAVLAPEVMRAIQDALREWDILPRTRALNLAETTDWLQHYMAPAMERLRAAAAEVQK